MRTTWKCGWRLLAIVVFLFIFILPSSVRALGSLVSGGVPMYERYEWGEPGHDPFSRGGEPGGKEEKNKGDDRGGNNTEGLPPDSNGTNIDGNPRPVDRSCRQGFFGYFCEEIMRWFKSLN